MIMKNILGRIEIFFLVTAVFAFPYMPVVRVESVQDLGFYVRSTATFVNDGTEIWNLTQADRSWSLFMNNSWQTVCLIDRANPLEMVIEDVDGNKIGVFDFESSLMPGESISDHVVYHVRSKSRSIPEIGLSASGTIGEIPFSLQEEYCGGHGFWRIEDPKIRDIAFSIARDENRVLVLVANLVSWIWNNIEYKSHDSPLYPDETLSLREGDCDEQAILFSTFCRVLGIPSYIQIGCIFLPEVYLSDDVGRIHYVANQIGWHGWSIVYVPPWGWLPVDLTYVMGSQSDPLNAIRRGAVTSQYTVQCMNVSENDYLMSDRVFKDMLESYNFTLYTTDEMGEINPLLGDLNGDDTVNIVDVAIVARAFGTTVDSQNWNRSADVNKDEKVDIVDIAIVALECRKQAVHAL